MRLTTIGTGTAAPARGRAQSAHLVEAGEVRLLLDCGSGAAGRMADLGIAWQGITHVALSHFHADHTADLATLMVAWRHGTLPPRSAALQLIGPAGTAALLGKLAGIWGEGVTDPGFPVAVREIAPDETVPLADGVTLSARKVPHTEESVAYSVATAARRVVYTGDTGADEELGRWAAGCDVLLAECSLPASMAIPGHLTPERCGDLAALAGPGVLALTHFYPPVEREDIGALVAKRFAGPVVRSWDGWSIELEDS